MQRFANHHTDSDSVALCAALTPDQFHVKQTRSLAAFAFPSQWLATRAHHVKARNNFKVWPSSIPVQPCEPLTMTRALRLMAIPNCGSVTIRGKRTAPLGKRGCRPKADPAEAGSIPARNAIETDEVYHQHQ